MDMVLAGAPYLFSGLFAVVLGMIWYHPRVFGSAWMQLSSITPETATRVNKTMILRAILGCLAAAWAAYVMSFMLVAFQVYDIFGALEVGFWIWAGFVVPAMLGMFLWEGKPFRVYVINVVYWLVLLLVIASALVVVSSGAPGQDMNMYASEQPLE